MKVEDFFREFRDTVADHAEPPFWTSENIVRYLNEAVQEACERAKLIEDRLTPAVCSIALQPNVSTYPLHPSVFEIKRATLRGRPLDETSVEEMDDDCPGWENQKGLPRCFIFEQASGAQPANLRLVRMPTQADTVVLTVYRGALKPLRADLDMGRPEIPERFHERLMDWMLHRAYLKQDADAYDPEKSATSLALFVQAFGERPDANVQRKQRDRRPPLVRMNW
ncbi:phage adaptor protein [Acidovorax sp. LjRoot117]|uniref:phage adaptor protein n=1 Tax=Acidovorax sp. LjRoot117 TaxID=3342255 RepID=UPI003ED1568E